MSDAYICDDCGETNEGTPTASIDTTLVRGMIELCAKCTRMFKAKYK